MSCRDVKRRLREILAVIDAGRYPEANVRTSIERLLPEKPTEDRT